MPAATEQDFQAWEKLVDEGMPFYQAAQEVGVTMMALKRGDAVRCEQGRDLSRERQAAKVEKLTERKVHDPEASPAIFTAWQKANHEAYRDKTQIEISGTINHEAKVVTLGAILEVTEGTGVDLGLPSRPRAALPSAEDLRPTPAERAAGSVPARPES